MEFRRCIPPCARFIARDDPHSKCILCLGFSHAREAVYGTSYETSALGLRIMNVNPPNFPGAHRAPPRLGGLESRDSKLEIRSSTIASSSARIPSLKGGSCHFSAICIVRSPVPGSSLFPLALLTRQPLTSPTLWVLWSRVKLPCR